MIPKCGIKVKGERLIRYDSNKILMLINRDRQDLHGGTPVYNRDVQDLQDKTNIFIRGI
jgi:hypothetical protein